MRESWHDAVAEMTDEEHRTFREKLNSEDDPKPYPGTKVTFFFPDRYKLEPIPVMGAVPRVGEIVSVGAYGRPTEGYDYALHPRWTVKSVYWVLRTNTRLKDRLLYPNQCHVEVYLKERINWWWEIKFWVRHPVISLRRILRVTR